MPFRRLYGLTVEQYEAMVEAQGGLCAACGQPETHRYRSGEVTRLAVDHDHETDAIRGLLCQRCNSALGRFGDSAELIEALAAYRRRY